MTGWDWELIALGATGVMGALVALAAAAGRRQRRRKSERGAASRQRSQPYGRRIEVVPIDDPERSSKQDTTHL
jgi:hypothetical protein